jgi:hypothetical protein
MSKDSVTRSAMSSQADTERWPSRSWWLIATIRQEIWDQAQKTLQELEERWQKWYSKTIEELPETIRKTLEWNSLATNCSITLYQWFGPHDIDASEYHGICRWKVTKKEDHDDHILEYWQINSTNEQLLSWHTKKLYEYLKEEGISNIFIGAWCTFGGTYYTLRMEWE